LVQGWTGLIAAKTYLDLAPDTDLLVVDNESSIGGVWCKERLYPDLYAQVSHPLFEYSFYDMPKEGITSDGFLSGMF
jgi:dimethylaniline monooxygenase (N-oxide forming)